IYIMERLATRFSRTEISLLAARFGSASFSSSLSQRSLTTSSLQRVSATCQRTIPGDFFKWGSLGSCRTSSFATGFAPLQYKPLGSIIDVHRAENKSAEDLAAIWDDYHLGRGHIGASMKANLYHLLKQRTEDCQYFVIPLWRGSGYTTMFVQVQMPHMLFTGLEDYKARGTQAAPYFTLSYYTEFAETKDLVLIRGDIVFTSKLSDSEAKWLMETAQSFYVNDARYKLVERFNKKTREFEFKDVLQALDMPNM
ncbi:hypothetical protein RJ639_010023, partial [Escallonia herrerae]